MFPYRDENETQRTPLITLGLIALNVLVWFVIQGAGSAMPLAKSLMRRVAPFIAVVPWADGLLGRPEAAAASARGGESVSQAAATATRSNNSP